MGYQDWYRRKKWHLEHNGGWTGQDPDGVYRSMINKDALFNITQVYDDGTSFVLTGNTWFQFTRQPSLGDFTMYLEDDSGEWKANTGTDFSESRQYICERTYACYGCGSDTEMIPFRGKCFKFYDSDSSEKLRDVDCHKRLDGGKMYDFVDSRFGIFARIEVNRRQQSYWTAVYKRWDDDEWKRKLKEFNTWQDVDNENDEIDFYDDPDTYGYFTIEPDNNIDSISAVTDGHNSWRNRHKDWKYKALCYVDAVKDSNPAPVTTTTTQCPTIGCCPCGYIYNEEAGKCFYLSTTTESFLDAQWRCAQDGAILVAPKTLLEQTYLMDNMIDDEYWTSYMPSLFYALFLK